jgi:hypothetical protein
MKGLFHLLKENLPSSKVFFSLRQEPPWPDLAIQPGTADPTLRSYPKHVIPWSPHQSKRSDAHRHHQPTQTRRTTGSLKRSAAQPAKASPNACRS